MVSTRSDAAKTGATLEVRLVVYYCVACGVLAHRRRHVAHDELRLESVSYKRRATTNGSEGNAVKHPLLVVGFGWKTLLPCFANAVDQCKLELYRSTMCLFSRSASKQSSIRYNTLWDQFERLYVSLSTSRGAHASKMPALGICRGMAYCCRHIARRFISLVFAETYRTRSWTILHFLYQVSLTLT